MLEAAKAAGNAAAMLNIIFSANKKTGDEIVKESLGDLTFFYYQYMDTFKRCPKDVDDMVDGIIYLELKVYFKKLAIEEKGNEGK
jgi:hypothetical protein